MRDLMRTMAALTLAAGLMTSAAFGARDDQKTEMTVNEELEIPGAILQPGDYTIELLESIVDDNVVLFRDDDGNLVSTVMAIDAHRNDVTGDTKFSFYETPLGDPPAIRTWFYPGNMNGHEFVYPETRGSEIAKYARRNVPTMPDASFDKLRKRESNEDEPIAMVVKEVTVYSLSPDSKKMDPEEAQKQNMQMDRRSYRPDEYVRGAEMEESRMARRIRKEIVTLPFYSLWDHIQFRMSDDGEVELMGSVYRPSLKRSVERVVKNVEGVTSVENNLKILPTSAQDDAIRRAAYRAIYGHPALQNYQLRAVPPIHIIVDNGNITLEGAVQNQMDKNVAGIQANGVSGAFKVENNLRIDN